MHINNAVQLLKIIANQTRNTSEEVWIYVISTTKVLQHCSVTCDIMLLQTFYYSKLNEKNRTGVTADLDPPVQIR